MKSIFDLHPNLDAYFETSDGVKFYNHSDASAHARSLENKKIKKVGRPVKKAPKTEKTTAKDRIAAINQMDSIEAVQKALENEKAPSVIKAGMDKIKALEEALAKQTGEGGDTGTDDGTGANDKTDETKNQK